MVQNTEDLLRNFFSLQFDLKNVKPCLPSESTGYLSTYPNPALYPVNPSTSFHLSSLSCVCTLIQQTVEQIQIFDRDTRQQLETVQIKSEEKEGSNLNNNVSALKPEVLTPEEKKNISLGKMSETKLLVDLPSIPQDTVEERDLSASNDKIDNSDSDCDSSDYEYTDATESEDSSCDSGVGLAEKKRVKPATVPKVFLTSYFPGIGGHTFQVGGHTFQVDGHTFQVGGHTFQVGGHTFQVGGHTFQVDGHTFQV